MQGSGFRGRSWWSVLVVAVAAGCGDGGTVGGTDGPVVDGGPGGPGFQAARSGFINIISGSPFIVNGAGLESLHAELANRPPVPAPYLVAADGECAVYAHPTQSFCDPACQDGICVDHVCTPYPLPSDAGLLEVDGLRMPLVFEPTAFGYQVRGERPVGDPFVAGAEVTVTAAGAIAPGFTLRAVAPAPIAAHRSVSDLVTLVPGDPATFTWDPGAGRVQLGVRRGWHGSPYAALIVCEVDDHGSLTIPDSLIDAYVTETGSGSVDYWWLARFDRDVVAGPGGPIELHVATMDYRFQVD